MRPIKRLLLAAVALFILFAWMHRDSKPAPWSVQVVGGIAGRPPMK